MEPPLGNDAAIRATNDEAFAAKVSAARKGYFQDPFVIPLLEALVPESANDPPSRQPMINRGTYARVTFVRRCVSSLIAAAPPGATPQVVSFGAGFDTLPFILISSPTTRPLRYIELDFADVVRSKAKAVATAPRLAHAFDRMRRISDGGLTASSGTGSEYALSVCDLRSIDLVRECLVGAGIDFAAPTVFLSECVLVYMPPELSDALIHMAQSEFSGLRAFVNYEPVEPRDAFGVQMVSNIALRGSPLLGIFAYPTVASQKERYSRLGWVAVDAMSMLDAFATLNEADVRRINNIEMLDEIEEWQFLMKHYCFVWARTAPEGEQCLLTRLAL